jgi:DNA-binding NarL/FixJ family response regulator
MKTIRVLLADDHTLFRKGLASLLEKEKCFEIMGEAENGAEAIARAQAGKPDLVLMDIHMPVVNGLEATRQITSTLSATRVVILTISEEDRDLFEAIKCGAHGYLSKKVEPEKLRELLEGVFRGEAPLSQGRLKIPKRPLRPTSRNGRKRYSNCWPRDSLTKKSGTDWISRKTP